MLKFSASNIDSLKSRLNEALPYVQASHRVEALARGMGHGTYAALRAATSSAGGVEIRMKASSFGRYLKSRGFTVSDHVLFAALCSEIEVLVRDKILKWPPMSESNQRLADQAVVLCSAVLQAMVGQSEWQSEESNFDPPSFPGSRENVASDLGLPIQEEPDFDLWTVLDNLSFENAWKLYVSHIVIATSGVSGSEERHFKVAGHLAQYFQTLPGFSSARGKNQGVEGLEQHRIIEKILTLSLGPKMKVMSVKGREEVYHRFEKEDEADGFRVLQALGYRYRSMDASSEVNAGNDGH